MNDKTTKPRDASVRDYQFLDCGDGRRLERFAPLLVDRPAPAAKHNPGLPEDAWRRAALRFTAGKGWSGEAPEEWSIRLGGARMRLCPAARGQLGVFPEHETVCSALERRLAAGGAAPPGGLRVLNLFAHTGLATLRLAALPRVGEVTHVDASRRAVLAARENAALSGLARAGIRWLVDDALSFMAREARRGKRYHLILADPPSHGRDRKSGREWRFDRDLGELLDLASRLLEINPKEAASGTAGGCFCLSCHSEGWSVPRILSLADGIPSLAALRRAGASASGCGLSLRSEAGGRALPAGCAVFLP